MAGGQTRFLVGTSPGTPPTGYASVYISSADSKVHFILDTGVDAALVSGAGAVSSVGNVAPAAGLTISGTNPITSTGTWTFALANDLAGLEALGSTGFAARTGADAWAQRTLQAPAAGITIANPAGVAGDPTVALANDLAGVEGLAANGIATRTATDTWAARTLTAGSSAITVTNGDGVAGNPTVDLPAAVNPNGKHLVPVMAGAMSPSATGGSAVLATIATAANQPDIQSLDFDATTAEYAQFAVPMPKSWNEGTVTFQVVWSHAATATNFGVVWNLQAVAISDDDAIAVAYGTAQTSTDTGGTTNDQYISPESSAITIAGTPAAQDVVYFRVYRDPAAGSDTMAIDARLHAVLLYITTDAATDA